MKSNFFRKFFTIFITFLSGTYFLKLIFPAKFMAKASPADDFQEFFDTMEARFGNTTATLPAAFYNILFPLGILLGVAGIIMAGYSYMTSQGNPEKVKEANEKISSAIVGVFFIVLSMVLLRVIIKTLIDPNF